jgi:IclR family acetate operon transcriptional repressor
MDTIKNPKGSPLSDRSGSLTKALDILEATVSQGQPPTTAELAVLLGLSKPTAHRLTSTLREFGFLQRDPSNGRLVVGDRLLALALDAIASAARLGPRHSILSALADETGETCNLGVNATGQVVYVDRVETKWPLGLRFEAGSRVPIHCTALGKMFLSEMPESQRRKYLTTLPLTRYTENTHTKPTNLEAELRKIRAEGVSFDDSEFMSGVVCIAVPIRGDGDKVVAGIAMSAPEARLTLDEARKHIPALKDAARKLSQTFKGED